MKKIILMFTILFSVPLWASGKLTLEGRANDAGDVRPVIGFSIYQPVFKSFAWNSWSGYGIQARDISDDVNWLTLKNEAQLNFRSFTLAPGYTYQHNFTDGHSNNLYTLKLEKQLW